MRFTVYRAEAPTERQIFDLHLSSYREPMEKVAVRYFLQEEDAGLRVAFFDEAEVVVEAEDGQTWRFQVEAEVSWRISRVEGRPYGLGAAIEQSRVSSETRGVEPPTPAVYTREVRRK